jgi:ATP-dependent helicase HepA
MKGFIVKHSGFGLGKVHSVRDQQLTVLFFSPPSVKTIVAQIDHRPVFKRALLPINTICDTAEGPCRITGTIAAASHTAPNRYQIEFNNELSKEVSEVDLVPKEIPPATSPLVALGELQLEGYGTFQKREALVDAWRSSVRGALGLRALLSSRIDLRPHQAYVAGAVLMDRVPRYLLADEVGLGKTIEAGIVIHDILERKPAAKILILCPGTLTQQWLCELYSKFSGKVFQLLELRLHEAKSGIIPERAIVAFTDALLHSPRLITTKWDLVVVDEAHHLLAIPHLYRVAQQLSENAPGCLLLSAIPAQRREEEYLRLLALLEPQRYKPEDDGAKEHFKQLYDRQIELGRKLSYISRRLGEFAAGTETAERMLQKIGELCSLPMLAQDQYLLASANFLDPSIPKKFMDEVHGLLHHVGDRYRISRRILRNRRCQLLDVEPDLRIDRELNRLGHQPDQLELDAGSAVRRLVHSLHASGIDDSVLLPLARHLFHSLCDPICFSEFIALASSSNPVRADLLEFDGQISYQEWAEYASSLWTAADLQPPIEILEDLEHAAENWQSNAASSVRMDTLATFLRNQHKKVPAKKFLIFAGFFGLGSRLAQHLVDTFAKASVAQFTWDMETKAKEKAVMRFKRDSQCWLMVSDETGGEGRNFQFVDELIHFDLPWHVSKIEQRIGRLDRLGRKIPKVCSNVLFALGEEEDGWLKCLESGFQVFTRSISGLEFALSQLEGRIAQMAIAEGYEGLSLVVNDIKSGSEAERVEDDVQGMLDEASLDRISAEVFRRAQSTPERDLALEEAFCDWFKFVTGNGALGFPPTGDLPDKCIVEFRPNQLPPGSIPLATGPDGVQPDRIGTFRRQIAQERPDLEFFSVGNEFFDAVCTSLHQSTKGRTYAVECQSTLPPWRGFEFSYRPFGKHNLLLKHPGHLKHLDRVFAVRPEHCFIGEDLQLASDNSQLLNLRRSFTNDTKDEAWKNFTLNNTRTQLLADRYTNPGWEALVNQAEAKARIEAKRHFSLSLATILDTESARIAEQIRQAQVARADGWEDEVVGLETLLMAINEWDVELDTVGFLSVNGGIIP